MKLVLATRNPGKVRELSKMLHTATNNKKGIEVLSLESYPDAPEVVEDGATYMENAVKKAAAIAAHTSHLTLADDAGLEVDALEGAPGIHSKRWAGEDATDAIRMAKLLEALAGVEDRRARFIAAIAIVHPDSEPEGVIGVCEGRIGHAPVGTAGFGYDPVFVPEGYQQSFAELGETLKNRISHRAKALEQAIALLQRYLVL